MVNIELIFLEVQYLKKVMKNKFKIEDESIYDIEVEYVVAKLPNPDTLV